MWLLRLYVSFNDEASAKALVATHELCEKAPGCKLQVVDIEGQAELSKLDGVKSAPTLLRLDPPPIRRISLKTLDPASLLTELGS